MATSTPPPRSCVRRVWPRPPPAPIATTSRAWSPSATATPAPPSSSSSSETDFSAKSDDFVALTQEIADAVAADGPGATDRFAGRIDDLKVTLKENIELGRVVHVAKSAGKTVDSYVHVQDGRGVNGVITVLDGGTPELAHDISIHIAFTKPAYLRRDEVPEAAVEEERQTLTEITRKEGKPEQALPKIVEGKLGGWFRDQVLLEQKFVRDEKQTIESLLGSASIDRFEQVVIGA